MSQPTGLERVEVDESLRAAVEARTSDARSVHRRTTLVALYVNQARIVNRRVDSMDPEGHAEAMRKFAEFRRRMLVYARTGRIVTWGEN